MKLPLLIISVIGLWSVSVLTSPRSKETEAMMSSMDKNGSDDKAFLVSLILALILYIGIIGYRWFKGESLNRVVNESFGLGCKK